MDVESISVWTDENCNNFGEGIAKDSLIPLTDAL